MKKLIKIKHLVVLLLLGVTIYGLLTEDSIFSKGGPNTVFAILTFIFAIVLCIFIAGHIVVFLADNWNKNLFN